MLQLLYACEVSASGGGVNDEKGLLDHGHTVGWYEVHGTTTTGVTWDVCGWRKVREREREGGRKGGGRRERERERMCVRDEYGKGRQVLPCMVRVVTYKNA